MSNSMKAKGNQLSTAGTYSGPGIGAGRGARKPGNGHIVRGLRSQAVGDPVSTPPLPSAPAVPHGVSPCTHLHSLPTRPVAPMSTVQGRELPPLGIYSANDQRECGEKTGVYSLLVAILWHML